MAPEIFSIWFSTNWPSLLGNDPNAGQFAIEPWSDAALVSKSLARLGGDQKSEHKKHCL
jgi:hypothetical protein